MEFLNGCRTLTFASATLSWISECATGLRLWRTA